MSKKLLLIIVFFWALRFISLNQSLWLDEAISANVAKNYSYQNIVTLFSPSDFHPPFYYLVLKTWTSIFGYTEFSLRLPSIIFSLATILLVFKTFGFWPSLLLALNPLYLYYSQEARMYSMSTLLVFCAYLAFRNRRIFLYFLFVYLSLSTFYGTIFVFAAISLFFLIKKEINQFCLYATAIILPLLFWSPLLFRQFESSRILLQSVVNWTSVLGLANLKNLILIPIKFTLGRISFYPKIVYYLLALILTVPLWTLVFLKSFERRLEAFVFWTTLLVGFVFSLFTPMFQYFRFLYLLPFLVIIINKNIFYLFIFSSFSLLYLLNPAYHREDWKSLAATLSDSVYMIPSASDPVKYYRPDVEINDLSTPITENQITVIPYVTGIHGLDYKSKLQSLGFIQEKISSFRQLTTEVWSRQFRI
ncbi:hypothetical protein COY20_03365 [Candidatus Shapirobacteria bacterium CG_4_10_14_0_2_um_filter_40_12]|uniref:Uncharacterized protein n=1 Tax=Candidatus Shapirobacteria bacterium CG_4_10_14_0_2_um_filter_40_12 TaxID=1974871 RepID=A0A2M7TSH1_9BACT|nr:MAG: hypothetical protein COY20_03365 [Candidatus Shapirobacteria bacterium CG_4_10_14_0_2_um_filter_40_12]